MTICHSDGRHSMDVGTLNKPIGHLKMKCLKIPYNE